MSRADTIVSSLPDENKPDVYQKLWRAVNDILAASQLALECNQDHRKFALESAKRLLKLAAKKTRISLTSTVDLNSVSDKLSEQTVSSAAKPQVLAAATATMATEFLFPTRIGRKLIAVNSTEILVVSALRAFDAVKRDVRGTAEEANNAFFARQMEDGLFWTDRKSAAFASLRASLAATVREYAKIDKFQISMWASVYEANGAFIKFHDHPLAVVSGVFFPEDSETPLILSDPRGGHSSGSSEFEPQAPFHRAVHVLPRKGEVVLFPPWLLHRTARHLRGDTRVVFAFNVYTDNLAGAWIESVLTETS